MDSERTEDWRYKMKTLMNFLKFFRELVHIVLIYGTILVIVCDATVFAIARDIDYAGFFLLSVIIGYCEVGITAGLMMCVGRMKLKYRTTLLLYIPAAVVGTAGGVLLAQFIIHRLFGDVVIFRGFVDLLKYAIGALIFVGFVILFKHLNASRKEKQLQLDKEKERAAGLEILHREAAIQTLRSKLNPHFLFNTLNTISELIYQDPDKAEKAVENLSEIYRQTLDMSEENSVTVSYELELIEKYLENERMRFGDRLQYSIDADPGCVSAKIPPLILQPFVENAITKGISPTKNGGKVSIAVKPEDSGLLFSIEDTGEGCDNFCPGFGIQNVLQRMEMLYLKHYRFDFKSDKGKGTRINLYIPGER